MKYIGGKQRIGKEIAGVMKQFLKEKKYRTTTYVEPFCGALGVLKHMVGHFKYIHASDLSEDIILLWKDLKSGCFDPPGSLSKEEWTRLKRSTTPSALRAFAGFACSFNGIFFSSYANHSGRNLAGEGRRALLKCKPYLLPHVTFTCSSYDRIKIAPPSCIYCDPPYASSKKGSLTSLFKEFDSTRFWNWARRWSRDGHIVFVSEFEGSQPNDFVCIWKKTRSVTCGTHGKRKGKNKKTECLFVHKLHVYK